MNYSKKSVTDVDVKGKRVLLRCDFNVPQDKQTGLLFASGVFAQLVRSFQTNRASQRLVRFGQQHYKCPRCKKQARVKMKISYSFFDGNIQFFAKFFQMLRIN